MLKSKANRPVTFHDARFRVLDLDQYKRIIGSGPWIPCGLPTVGFRRFYEAARTEGLSADLVATVPWNTETKIAAAELVELVRNDRSGSDIYRVIQVQERRDAAPACYQLTLQHEKVRYEDRRNSE